jgi:hypothetical protein
MIGFWKIRGIDTKETELYNLIMNKENQKEKELTLNDLAQMMESGFKRVDEGFEKAEKSVDKKIEWLATVTQNNFLGIEGRLDKIDGTLGNIEANLNKKVDRFEHKDLEIRVEKVEEKLKLKQKFKFA